MRETSDHLPGFLPFNSDEHHIRVVPFTAFLQRELGTKDAIVYWHSVTKNWVVAISRPRDGRAGMWEIMVLNNDPAGENPRLTPEQVHYVKRRWFRPDDPYKMSQLIRSRHRACERGKIDEDRSALSVDQFLARRLTHVKREQYAFASRAKRQARVYC